MKRFIYLVLCLGLLSCTPLSAQITGPNAQIRLRDTNTPLPDGMWRLRLHNGKFSFERSTDQTGNFSTFINALTLNADGSVGINPVLLSLSTPTIGPNTGQQHVLPAVSSDTVSLLNASQTLQNKTISGAQNTLSNIGNGSLTNSSVTVTAGAGLSGGGTAALGGAVTLTNAGVTAITGTANQVNASASTGALTLSLPQNIHTGATPTFAGMTLTDGTVGAPSYSFTNEVGLGLYRTGSHSLGIAANGATALTVEPGTITVNNSGFASGTLALSHISGSAYLLNSADTPLFFGTNGGVGEWLIDGSGGAYALEPSTNNSQDIGTVSFAPRSIYLGTSAALASAAKITWNSDISLKRISANALAIDNGNSGDTALRAYYSASNYGYFRALSGETLLGTSVNTDFLAFDIGGATKWRVGNTADGYGFIPTLNVTYDIGADTQRVRNLYTQSVIVTPSTPADNATCTPGQFYVDTSFIYVCTVSGTVKRAALSSF